jgi:CheY-like chemotaxis protein
METLTLRSEKLLVIFQRLNAATTCAISAIASETLIRSLVKYSPQCANAASMSVARSLKLQNSDDACHLDMASGAPRILVVEDHEIGREVLCLMLRRMGLFAEKADNGIDAINKITQAMDAHNGYALILMDFSMPALGGIETTIELRRQGFDAETLPIVAVTASIDNVEITRFIEAGGQTCLIKPVTNEGLAKAVGEWLPDRSHTHIQPSGTISQALFDRYEQRKITTFAALQEYITLQYPTSQQLSKVADLLHKLAGIAGAFNDAQLSQAASKCEAAIVGISPAEAKTILVGQKGFFIDAT